MPTDHHQTVEILTRGVVNVLPDKDSLAELMAQRPIKLYLGIDPTGNELHLGHSVPLRKLQQFAEAGHEAILLVGNGTVRIGDPTGRDSTRPMLSDDEIEAHFQNWQQQAEKILDFERITVKRNGDWLDQLSYVDLVKLMTQTTIQQLIERDMFQERLKAGQPIHGHELIYPLMQGYDSVAMDVDLEIGGTDQTFNMMMGRHLQKTHRDKSKWVLATPLINGTDGRKMSKSYHNYVALTEPANDMYGKLMRINDDMVSEYFTVLTDVPQSDIAEMDQAMATDNNPMEFKKRLAFSITAMLHSAELAHQAQAHFEQTVQRGQLPDQLPTVELSAEQLPLLTVLKECWPEASNAELRRLIEQGGVELQPSGERPKDPQYQVDVRSQTSVKVGKRRYYQLRYTHSK